MRGVYVTAQGLRGVVYSGCDDVQSGTDLLVFNRKFLTKRLG
jgi:hypothetical protein